MLSSFNNMLLYFSMGVVDAKDDATCCPIIHWLDRKGFTWVTLLSNIQSKMPVERVGPPACKFTLADDVEQRWPNLMSCFARRILATCFVWQRRLFIFRPDQWVVTTTLTNRISPRHRGLIMSAIVVISMKLVAKCQWIPPFILGCRLITWGVGCNSSRSFWSMGSWVQPIVVPAPSFFFQDKNLVLVCFWVLKCLWSNLSNVMWF
jgi:hypothetical protein